MKLGKRRVLVFGTEACGFCAAMDKMQVVPKFIAKQAPDKFGVFKLLCADKEGDVPDASEYLKHYKISDGYGVTSFPTVIVEGARADGTAIEICRMDAESASAFTLKELERLYKEGLEELEDVDDDSPTQEEASRQIGWDTAPG